MSDRWKHQRIVIRVGPPGTSQVIAAKKEEGELS